MHLPCKYAHEVLIDSVLGRRREDNRSVLRLSMHRLNRTEEDERNHCEQPWQLARLTVRCDVVYLHTLAPRDMDQCSPKVSVGPGIRLHCFVFVQLVTPSCGKC